MVSRISGGSACVSADASVAFSVSERPRQEYPVYTISLAAERVMVVPSFK